MGDIGGILPEVVFPMVAEGAPLADRVDKVLIDSVWGGGGALVWCCWGGVPGRCWGGIPGRC